MKKKFLFFSLLICLFLTGCKSVQKMSLEDIINKKVERNVETYNTYRKGYKYYLPSGLGVVESTDYNEVLRDDMYRYYLYIDAVSYFNKVIVRCVLVFVLALVTCIIIRVIMPNNLFYSIVMCLVCVIMALLMAYVFGLTKGERSFVIVKVKEIVRKRYNRDRNS